MTFYGTLEMKSHGFAGVIFSLNSDTQLLQVQSQHQIHEGAVDTVSKQAKLHKQI